MSEFNCLYIPQGRYVISMCGYEVQMNMAFFYFEQKSSVKVIFRISLLHVKYQRCEKCSYRDRL